MVLSHGKGISPKANASLPLSARSRSPTQHLWPWMCMILVVSFVVLENSLCLFMCLETYMTICSAFVLCDVNMLQGCKSDDRIICDWRLCYPGFFWCSWVCEWLVSYVQDTPEQRQNLRPLCLFKDLRGVSISEFIVIYRISPCNHARSKSVANLTKKWGRCSHPHFMSSVASGNSCHRGCLQVFHGHECRLSRIRWTSAHSVETGRCKLRVRYDAVSKIWYSWQAGCSYNLRGHYAFLFGKGRQKVVLVWAQHAVVVVPPIQLQISSSKHPVLFTRLRFGRVGKWGL